MIHREKRSHVPRHCDTVQLSTPGGGGHGNPGKRSEAERDVDLKFGYVTKTGTPT
jgi:N-methylhydantoinase B